MAHIDYNSALEDIRGRVSQFVYRRQKDGTVVVSKLPSIDPNRVLTPSQVQHRQRFAEASAHVKNLLDDPALKAAYQKIAAKHGKWHLRAMVLGDVLKPPTIKPLDLSKYGGAVGDTIRIVAKDNVGIARIRLVIRDNTDRLDLESAEKVTGEGISETVEWIYKTTVALPDESLNHQVDITVAAYDLAGNEVTSTVSARP